MSCAPIITRLVAEALSMWTLTSVPVVVCTYDVNGDRFKERQVGMSCERKPSEIPRQVLQVAQHNACAATRQPTKEAEKP